MAFSYHKDNDTSNDESIARAIAAADQNQPDALPLRILHDSDPFMYDGGTTASTRHTGDSIRPPRGRIFGHNELRGMPPPPLLPGTPDMQRMTMRGQMCNIPCVVGPNQVCVEMMVDTGAQMSVISLELAQELGLEETIDTRHQGIATGVGRARILGKIHNVLVTLGHVEFHMEFIVLDVPADKILLLGLDQMRKYKCIVDLERDLLIFGGAGGVEVTMLPPDESPSMRRRSVETCAIS